MKFGEMPKEMQDKLMNTLIRSQQELLLASTIHFEDQPDIIFCALESCIVNFVMNSADPKHYHDLMNEIVDHLKNSLKHSIRQKNLMNH